VNPDARPQPRDDVDFDVVDGEGLVLSPDGPGLHRLNGSAMAVWLACDGTTTVDGIVADLAERFGIAPPARRDVRTQVRDVVEELVTLRLVDVPGRPPPATSPCDSAATRRRGAGGLAYLLVPESPCRARLDEAGWDAVVGVEVGDLRLGVHTDTVETAAWVRQVVGPRAVDDPSAPPNVRVERGSRPDGSGSTGRRPGVYDGHRWVGGAGDDDGLARLVRARLGAQLPLGPDAGEQVRLGMEAVLGPEGVVLRRWYAGPPREGDAVVLPPPVVIDTDRMVVLEPDPRLAGTGGSTLLPVAGIDLRPVAPPGGEPHDAVHLDPDALAHSLAGELHLAPGEPAAGRLRPLLALARRLGATLP
jgi:hypothetical protein